MTKSLLMTALPSPGAALAKLMALLAEGAPAKALAAAEAELGATLALVKA